MSDVRILIVDDNRDFAYLLQLSLASVFGCRVVGVAADGRSALEAVGRLQPDVVLLDIALPGSDGLEILKDIGRLTRSPLVFVMSAIRSREICEEAVALGAAHYFIKPIDTGTLTYMIREAFGGCMDTAEKAAKLLHSLKVPPDIRGFKYLKDIITHSLGNNAADFDVFVRRTALENGVETAAVRRALRYAIGVAWDMDACGSNSFFDPWKRSGKLPPDAAGFVREAVRRISADG